MTPRSSLVTQGRDRSPNRAMLRALGMQGDDFTKPQIGIASSWYYAGSRWNPTVTKIGWKK